MYNISSIKGVNSNALKISSFKNTNKSGSKQKAVIDYASNHSTSKSLSIGEMQQEKYDKKNIIRNLDYDKVVEVTGVKYFYKNGILIGTLLTATNVFKYAKSSKCKRYNPLTQKLQNISILDKENKKSWQYGADQGAFRYNFDILKKDKYIWQQLQLFFPISSFKNESEAMDFYKRYFNLIYNTGCGYAAITNVVFKMYEGKEEEFQKTFGFPMYTYDNGGINFNYEYMMLHFFNYFIGFWINAGEFSLEDFEKGVRYAYSNNLYQTIRNLGGTYPSIVPSVISSYMNKYGKNVSSPSTFSLSSLKPDKDINDQIKRMFDVGKSVVVCASGHDLYKMDGTLEDENGFGHAMLVTGFTKDGYPIVSSWGREYILHVHGRKTNKNNTYEIYIIN